jgi:hypothetical protein
MNILTLYFGDLLATRVDIVGESIGGRSDR